MYEHLTVYFCTRQNSKCLLLQLCTGQNSKCLLLQLSAYKHRVHSSYWERVSSGIRDLITYSFPIINGIIIINCDIDKILQSYCVKNANNIEIRYGNLWSALILKLNQVFENVAN